MQARIKWVENAAFVGSTGSGHSIVVDGPPDIGGQNLGMRPMELMLLSVGACSAVDVVHILKKGRHAVADVQVEVQGDRADTDPKVFTKVHLHFVVSGAGLSAKVVERAVALSAEKYCSASIMLGRAGAEITHDFELR
ncbi:MAG TPA: OsmC family protein [Verrucomicrobiae bacterium]|nr:OsmC family protein [Verrucomicrobiae bacterium]